jgi:tetratricopeptide (TPR) repeat protein
MPIALKTEPRAGRFSLGLGHLIFVVVLVLRLRSLLWLTHSQLLIPSRGDMHFYNDWATQILHGQFTQHLAFYGLPGYAYLLAALYKIFGENPFVPGLLQAAVDAGTTILIFSISSAIFARTGSTSSAPNAAPNLDPRIIGVVAALGWALFVPAQAYSVILMPTAWFVFVFWLVVWRIVRTNAALRTEECFFLALLVGLTATAVATVLAVVPLVFVAILFRLKGKSGVWRSLMMPLAALLVGLLVGTSPCWIHNYFIAHDPVGLSAHSGINFWIGNNPQANGYPRFPPGLRAGQSAMLQDSIDQAEAVAGRPLKHAEVSRYWSDQTRNYVGAAFGSWLKLIARKLRNFWSAFQYDDVSVITILREQGMIFPGLHFGVVAALAIPGIFFAQRLAPTSRWILAALLLSMFTLLAVFITERYRLVAVPGLLIFAAFGLSMLWQKIASGELAIPAVYLALLVPSTLFVAWPQHDPSLWALDAYNAGWQALESNNLELAERKLAIAHAYVPENSETLFALGNLRLGQNDPKSASTFYRAVLKIDERHKGAFNNLGVIALDATDYQAAELWFRRAADVDPRNAKTHFLLAKALLGKNDHRSAQNEIDAAISLKPDQPEFIQLKNEIDRQLPR